MQTDDDRLGAGAGPQDDHAVGLLRDAARGNREAMTCLYDLFQGSVYRLALTRLSDPVLAADILNDTMVEIWQSAGRFRGESKVLTWVLGIAHRMTMDRLGAPPESEARPDESATDMTLVLDRLDDARRVRDAVRQLSAVQRSALHLAFQEDLSYAEMAEVLGCPEGTAKARVFDAKQALKSLLAA
jgi:RNA polymerase sigma-70 factor (ECF subfamily)